MSINEIQNEAAAWLAREDRGLSYEEFAELDAWKAQSSLHEVCYLRLQAAWERADRMAAINQPMVRPFASAQSEHPPRLAIGFLMAVAIIALVGGYYAINGSHSVASYATALGDTRSVRLPDGTRIQLNSNTKLQTDISSDLRVVTLDDGEAYFEVVHDPKRPFVVYAGNKRITDLGTKFSVYRTGNDVRVLVSEGKVQIEVIGASTAKNPVVADGGHVVVTKGDVSLVSEKPERTILNDLSWRSGILILDQKTLAQAAAEFNRYNARQLIIEGRARDMKIGGRFKANGVNSFIALLHQAFGLSIDDRGTTVIVSR